MMQYRFLNSMLNINHLLQSSKAGHSSACSANPSYSFANTSGLRAKANRERKGNAVVSQPAMSTAITSDRILSKSSVSVTSSSTKEHFCPISTTLPDLYSCMA
jgi:hypothetical protein